MISAKFLDADGTDEVEVVGLIDELEAEYVIRHVAVDSTATNAEHGTPTFGTVLCSSKHDATVKIALLDCEQVMAARYLMVLPMEEELRAEAVTERAAAEQFLLQNQAK